MKKSKFLKIGLDDAFEAHKSSWKIFDSSRGISYFGQEEPPPKTLRLYLVRIAILAVLVIFLGRLFMLTVVSGDELRELADENRIKLTEIEAPRGTIYDRRGQVIAESRVVRRLVKNGRSTEISGQQAKDLESAGLAGENFEGDLGQIYMGVERVYPYGEALAHVLGYVQKESEANSVGRLGVESTYEDFLKGENGKKLVEVDASGKKVSILGEEEPKVGRSLHLSVDASLQKVVFDALKKQAEKGSKRAAAIVADVSTGQVLALVSMPSFDPADIAKSLNDENKPFFNRAVGGAYPPGSIFKIVSALAGLESGQITKDTQVEDVGQFELGGSRFANWYFLSYGRKDGVLKIDRAIARSNDIFFYRLGEKTGLENLRQMAIRFGFGQETGIDLPDEAFGLVPSEEWKRSTFSDNWYLGDTMHLAIGQGFMLTTPLQINTMTSTVASGKLAEPYLASKIEGAESAAAIDINPKIKEGNFVSNENLNLVKDGMKQACETGGTGWPFFTAPYKVGCKTGTAEKSLGNPHAWFTAFAPFENPEVAITVLVEDGGEGSSIAGPVAREVLDWWTKNRK